MIVLDASVLIGHYSRTDLHNAIATRLVRDHVVDGVAASSVTLAEALVGPTRAGRLGPCLERLRVDGVRELPLPVDAAHRLALLQVQTGLKLPDCCVLLAAQMLTAQGCSARGVATFDDRLARAARGMGFVALGAGAG